MKGMLQVYTGDGKGKTTAAIGLAIRALGAGFKVYIGQFIKGMMYNELTVLNKLDGIVIKQYGLDCFIEKEPTPEDIRAARFGLADMAEVLSSGEYQLVIMDEANIATYYGLFTAEELLTAINNRADGVEVVVTGRKADDKLIKAADLVTDMREVKHYYQRGILARDGIDK